jgi:hypothetical protein
MAHNLGFDAFPSDFKADDQRSAQIHRTDILKVINRPASNFKWLLRLKATDLTPEVYKHYVIDRQMPMCIEGLTQGWDRELFSWNWLKDKYGDTELINSPRDVTDLEDLQGWTVRQYVDYFLKPAEQRNRTLYGKDIPCPETWRIYLTEKLPHYFSATSDDLVGDVAKELQPIATMVYLSFSPLWIPGHKPICGSLGHELMVYGESDAGTFWFCTLPSEKEKVASFWKQQGQSIDHDNFFMPLDKLALADFTVYVCEQREGDFVIIPSEGAYQAVHTGGRRVAIAWNRITPLTILQSYRYVLPLYHTLCKTEVFRLKTLAYYGLVNRTNAILNQGEVSLTLAQELPPLIRVVDEIIESEWVEDEMIHRWKEPFAITRFTDDVKHSRACNYCNCDIFNRCYHCSQCQSDYDVCLNCVAEGRGCVHNASLTLMEYLSMHELRATLHRAHVAYTVLATKLTSLDAANQTYIQTIEKFTYRDEYSIASIAYDMAQHYKLAEGKTEHCHQCKIHKPLKYIVRCRKNANDAEKRCKLQYCAMCLWNRYAIRFFLCRKNKMWQCPSCMQICNCAACLRARKINPREHKLTVDVESLEEISVYLPPAFQENNCEALPGPCDRKPKGVRTSYGWTEEEMRAARTKKRQGEVSETCELEESAAPSYVTKKQSNRDEDDTSSKLLTLIRVLQADLSEDEAADNENEYSRNLSTRNQQSNSLTIPAPNTSPQSLKNSRKRLSDEQNADISSEALTSKRAKFQQSHRPTASELTSLINTNIPSGENRALLRELIESMSHTPSTLQLLNSFIASLSQQHSLSSAQFVKEISALSPSEHRTAAPFSFDDNKEPSIMLQKDVLNDSDFDWDSGLLFVQTVGSPMWPAVRIRKEAYQKISPNNTRMAAMKPADPNEHILVHLIGEPPVSYVWVSAARTLPFADFYAKCSYNVTNNSEWSVAVQRHFHSAVEIARQLYNKHHPERPLAPSLSWSQTATTKSQLPSLATPFQRSDVSNHLHSHSSPFLSTTASDHQFLPQSQFPAHFQSFYSHNIDNPEEEVSNLGNVYTRKESPLLDPLTG